MTEAEWMKCDYPTPMLQLLRGKADDRQCRLFAVACCRRVWASLPDLRSRAAVLTAERYADGGASAGDLAAAQQGASNAFTRNRKNSRHRIAAHAAILTVILDFNPGQARVVAGFAALSLRQPHALSDSEDPAIASENEFQTRLLRDIFGNPFRSVAFSPDWRTSTVVALAQQMYESRDFGVMPILADALQDAGCDSDDILDHCRAPGPHVRGCWVVDLVLGKG
jgi:hypothetical protein